jgi:hypothetical protein
VGAPKSGTLQCLQAAATCGPAVAAWHHAEAPISEHPRAARNPTRFSRRAVTPLHGGRHKTCADAPCTRHCAASMAAVLAGLKSVDFYRKLKRDLQQELTEASIAGAALVAKNYI